MKDAVDEGKIKGCSIRFANVYSKNERYPKHIIPYIINSFREQGKVVLLENSRKNRRTFLHNYDSCSAVLALVATDTALDGKSQPIRISAVSSGIAAAGPDMKRYWSVISTRIKF